MQPASNTPDRTPGGLLAHRGRTAHTGDGPAPVTLTGDDHHTAPPELDITTLTRSTL